MKNTFNQKVYTINKDKHLEDNQVFDPIWKYKPIQTSLPFNGKIIYTPTRAKAIKCFPITTLVRHSSQQEFKQPKVHSPVNVQIGFKAKNAQIVSSNKFYNNQNNFQIKNQNNKSKFIDVPPQYHQATKKNQYSTFWGNYSSIFLKQKLTENQDKNIKLQKRSSNESNNSGRKNNYLKSTSSTQKSKDGLPNFFKNKFLSRDQSQSQGHFFNRENFQIIRRLGQGKFGTVYLVKQNQSNYILAMKVVKKSLIISNSLLDQFIREIKIQSYLNHPNILKLYSFFNDQEYFYTLMELGCDGQLYKFIQSQRQISQEGTSYITKALLSAVNHMHERKIIHRDLKPQNIVLILGEVKICDFGWAVKMDQKDNGLRTTFCGTPLYFSPELLGGNKYDEKIDLWAIGILAYQLHLCQTPFNIRNQADLQKIIDQQVNYPNDCLVSPEFRQFMAAVLQKNPKLRPNSQTLLNMHFIKKYSQLETCEQFC